MPCCKGDIVLSALRSNGTAIALILLCGLLVYHNVPGNSFHYDDEHSILENPHLRSLDNAARFFVDAGTFSGMPEARMYRPLLLLSYALNYALDGYEPLGYHLVNIALHLATALLLWRLGLALGLAPRAALVAGVFFVVHPVLGEPVNYISSRSSLMATALVLTAFLLALRHRASWPSSLAYGAALLCKSSAIAFVPLLALWVFLGTAPKRWRILLAPAALSVLYVLGTRAIVGKALLEPVRGYVAQISTQIKALVFYVYKVAMPVNLSVEPQFRLSPHPGDVAVLLAIMALVSGALILLHFRSSRLVFFAVAWFFVALLPPSLVPLNVLVNEHRLYMPMAGVALGLATLIGSVLSLRLLYFWVFVLVAIALSIQRNGDWQSEERLWADAVAKGPLMARPYVNWGQALLKEGLLEESIVASRRALEIRPDMERAYYNLGTAYMHQGELELAEAYLRRALKIDAQLLPAYNNLGNIYQEQGRSHAALEQYAHALALAPHASLYHNMGNAFLKADRQDSAQVYFRRALYLDPLMREAYKGLFKAQLSEERLQQAIETLQEALVHWPGDQTFLLMLGESYAALGQEQQALAAYRRAGKSPDQTWGLLGAEALRRGNWQAAQRYVERALRGGEDAVLYNDLGAALVEQGQTSAALEAFRTAARLEPTLARAFANIGRIYLKHGRLLDALAALERAVELDGEDGDYCALLGQAHERAKFDEAVEWYARAVARAPEQVEYRNNLGYLHQQLGRFAEAERLYRSALERDPQRVETLFNLGLLYLEDQRYDEAVNIYRRLVERHPEHVDAQVNLATAWINADRPEKAAQAYEAVLKMGVESPLKERIKAQLRALRGR